MKKNIPSILWRHSYYLQYSSELMFKRSGESFSKGWADFLSNWKGTSLRRLAFTLWAAGGLWPQPAFPPVQAADKPRTAWLSPFSHFFGVLSPYREAT